MDFKIEIPLSFSAFILCFCSMVDENEEKVI